MLATGLDSAMIEHLLKACDICETNGLIGSLRNVRFHDGRLSAFNGVLHFQAPSTLDVTENFEVSHEKLAKALRACGENMTIGVSPDFLQLKNGPLRVRVRKLEPGASLDRISVPPSVQEQKGADLLPALRIVRDFISTDASRPWSVAALIKDGYVWATNNLALVRTPISIPVEMRIPAAVVYFLCDLPTIDYWHVDDKQRLVFICGRELIRAPQSAALWPDMVPFFSKLPAEMPEIPLALREAASVVTRFADRHVGLDASKVETKTAGMETEYDIDFTKGAGTYNARLLSLILERATHADFSFYPAPIFFRGDALEGTAVGIKQV